MENVDDHHSRTTAMVVSYLHSLSQTPHRLKKRMLATWTPDQELNQVRQRSGADMKRKLTWYDLIAMGVGGMLGVGVFVTTGHVARNVAGPAVSVSYVIAGISALLSSMCYSEFSIAVPVAGGAFSYLRVTFGEFVGYFAGTNILMEYVLSNAAVARSFTEYLSSTFGIVDSNSWRIEVTSFVEGYNMLDFPAVGLIVILTMLLCHSTKESSVVNLVMTVFHVVFFGFIIVTGFSKGSIKNLTPPPGRTGGEDAGGGFAPYGVKGLLDGAALVYFSYIGYDSVSTLAEEIRSPSRDIRVGILSSVIIVSLLYCLMSTSLCMMLPYTEIPDNASFSAAFQKLGWGWTSTLVGIGASLGIVASLMVAMLGQARYLCVIGRARLVPVWLAKVHPKTGTPLNATIFLGFCTASLALFTDLSIVIEMVSIGTLLVFYLVANALIYRRYTINNNNNNTHNPPLRVILFLILLTSTSLGFSLSWTLITLNHRLSWVLVLIFGASMVFFTACFGCFASPTTCKCSRSVEEDDDDDEVMRMWQVPLMPWPAALSIFLNVFLMTTLKPLAYKRFGIWSGLITVLYVLYGVHSTYTAEELMNGNGTSDNTSSAVICELTASTTVVETTKVELNAII